VDMGGLGSRHVLSFRACFGFETGRKYPTSEMDKICVC